MNIIQLDEKPLIFLGDHHGDWHEVLFKLNLIKNCNVVSVGDMGIGFKYKKESEYKAAEMLNSSFKEMGVNFYGIRGNHDDPAFFRNKDRIALNNFELLEDYSILKYQDKKIQCIGGAVSIDRLGRREGHSYWSEEVVNFDKNKCQKCDVLVTHTAPSFCFPKTFNELVYGWAREDAYLLEDLTDERAIMDEIFKICQPTLHLYGHFHSSWTEQIENCKHKLLNINELVEYNTRV